MLNLSVSKCTSFSLNHEGTGEKKLTIWDLHALLFLLLTAANKWREIGSCLHFPKHVLDAIGQKLVCIVGGPERCLREVLARWLGRDKPQGCVSTTNHTLVRVLRLPEVDEGGLANKVERTFQTEGICMSYIKISIYFVFFIAVEQVEKRIDLLKKFFKRIQEKALEQLEENSTTVKNLHRVVCSLNKQQQQNDELLQCSHLRDAFDYLSRYWSYLSYHLLEGIIVKFLLKDAQEEIEEFKTELKSFKEETPLEVFANADNMLNRAIPETFEKLPSIHEFTKDSFLKDIDRVHADLKYQYKFEDCALILYDILPGSIMIVWLIPKSAKDLTFAVQEGTFRTIKLVELQFHGKCIYEDDLTSEVQDYARVLIHGLTNTYFISQISPLSTIPSSMKMHFETSTVIPKKPLWFVFCPHASFLCQR